MNLNIDKIQFSDYDAVIIPGSGGPRDGLSPIDSLPEWVRLRLDKVVECALDTKVPLILLSAGTYHKAGALDLNGRNFQESTAMSLYLEKKGVDMSRVFEENSSYDTVGNAFFSRVIHTETRGWSKLLVVMNEFHYQRVKFIFDWIFGLPGHSEMKYRLNYAFYPDSGLSSKSSIDARKERERLNLELMIERVGKLEVKNLLDLHRWLYSRHDLYRSSNRGDLVLKKRQRAPDNLCY